MTFCRTHWNEYYARFPKHTAKVVTEYPHNFAVCHVCNWRKGANSGDRAADLRKLEVECMVHNGF